MKKLNLLALSILCMFSTQLHAQESDTAQLIKNVRISLFVGPTFNSLKSTAASSDNYQITKGDNNVGFSFGLNADYNINSNYAIYTGLGLDWRGGGIKVVHDSTKQLESGYLKDADVKYKKMQYLTIPLGLKLKAVESGKMKVYVQTGLDLGILLSQKGDYIFKLADNTIESKTNEKLRNKATVFPINIGWCIGLGTEYKLNPEHSIFAAMLYRNGFIDATTPNSNDESYKFSDGNIRSNALVIRVGYFF